MGIVAKVGATTNHQGVAISHTCVGLHWVVRPLEDWPMHPLMPIKPEGEIESDFRLGTIESP
eukprot:8237883-Prorocentrum_lima.AAC.1